MKSLTFSCLICALDLYFALTLLRKARDCAIIIRRGAKKLERGALYKIAAKIGGAQSKITHLTEGGP